MMSVECHGNQGAAAALILLMSPLRSRLLLELKSTMYTFSLTALPILRCVAAPLRLLPTCVWHHTSSQQRITRARSHTSRTRPSVKTHRNVLKHELLVANARAGFVSVEKSSPGRIDCRNTDGHVLGHAIDAAELVYVGPFQVSAV